QRVTDGATKVAMTFCLRSGSMRFMTERQPDLSGVIMAPADNALSSQRDSLLPPSLLERVLESLSFTERPAPSRGGLRAISAAWCQHIPFDTVRKLIHVRAGNPGPLPGHNSTDFFEAWLQHGTGGTCWAGAGPLQSFLGSLGFDAVRGI